MVHAGLVTRDRAGAELFTSIPGAVYDVDKTRDLRLFGIKQDWLIQSSPSLLWQLGFDLRRQRADYSLHSLVWRDPNDPSEDPLGLYPVETVGQGEESGTLVSAYSASRLRLFGPATVEAGLRYDRASHTHDSDLSPRLSAMVDLSRGVLLRLGWGQYRQMHDIHDEIALNAGGHYDPSELSTQWTGGIERVFCGGTAVRVEAYHKHTDNPRPVYRNWVAGSRCAVATPSPWPANACAASTTSTSPTPPSASPPKTTPRAISATPSVSI
jgi:outer membrane receptor protein involved in Fe transport